MAKARSTYICSNCGKRSPAYFGRCPQCGEFGAMEEHVEQAGRASVRGRVARSDGQRAPRRLAEIDMSQEARIAVPIEEFNRVLGGGLVPGSLVLLGGEPGIGKSTLVLELSARLAAASGSVLYVSGEESARQIRMRAERLGLSAADLYLLTENGPQRDHQPGAVSGANAAGDRLDTDDPRSRVELVARFGRPGASMRDGVAEVGEGQRPQHPS